MKVVNEFSNQYLFNFLFIIRLLPCNESRNKPERFRGWLKTLEIRQISSSDPKKTRFP